MVESAPTLGSIDTSTSHKQRLARQSLEFNVKDPTFRKLFPQYVQLHKERQEAKMAMLNASSAGVSSSISQDSTALANDLVGEAGGVFPLAAGVIAILSAILFAMRFL